MGDVSPSAELADVPPAALYGLLTHYVEPALSASYEFAWERDSALMGAVDRAVRAALRGKRVGDAPRPRWLRGLVLRELRAISTSSWSHSRFARVRRLERLGAIELEADDTYVLAMVSALGPGKARKLRADPDLIERALWRVFEVEGGGEISLTNVDRFGRDEWRTTLLELSADGTLDRQRLLQACLSALNRDFAAYRASWYSTTYLALSPTLEETAALQEDVRRLLAVAVPATVAFALKQLTALHKAGTLEIAETLEALPPATVVKPKGTALAALALARSARIEHTDAVVRVAHTALGHPHAEVQRAAAALLAECGRDDTVLAAAEDFTPSVRADLGLPTEAVTPHAAPTGQSLSPLPRTVSTVDLAERVAALLEDASDVGELEGVLTALTKPGAGELLGPLKKRAKAVVARDPEDDLDDTGLPGQVARLVLDLLGAPVPPAVPEHTAQRFVVRRMRELGASGAPLLATPDLPGGWVSPVALVERLRQQPTPRHHDLVAALLRLHPEGREDAARAAAGLPAAVRFALTGVRPSGPRAPGERDGPAAWWVAAQRSLAPYAAAELPTLRGDTTTDTWDDNGRERRICRARFAVTASIAARRADDRPTELKTRITNIWGDDHLGGDLGAWVPTLAALWPHDAEHFLALTCMHVLESPSSSWISHDVPRTLDALAAHPGRLGVLAATTLAAGLSAEHRNHRLHATDAFLDLVPTGRVPVEEIATAMARYAPAWPANRWAEALASACAAPGGADVVLDLLMLLLPQLPSGHRGLNKLLELLRDQSILLGRPIADPALRGWLGQLTGGSVAAKTARLLLG